MSAELHDKIRAEVERRLAVARAASQARGASTPNGEHWRWECSNCDATVEINDVLLLDEFLECPDCESCGLALRSVEQYPTASVGELPHFVVNSAEEIRPVDGLFITVHDPADAAARGEVVTGQAAPSHCPHRPVDRGPVMTTTVEDLTPAALTPESLARVHALWSWTYRMDVCQLQAAMRKLTVRELRDVRLATDMLDSYVTTELLRRLVPGPTVGQVAEALLTPDSVGAL